jgi:hypothetical protein
LLCFDSKQNEPVKEPVSLNFQKSCATVPLPVEKTQILKKNLQVYHQSMGL